MPQGVQVRILPGAHLYMWTTPLTDAVVGCILHIRSEEGVGTGGSNANGKSAMKLSIWLSAMVVAVIAIVAISFLVNTGTASATADKSMVATSATGTSTFQAGTPATVPRASPDFGLASDTATTAGWTLGYETQFGIALMAAATLLGIGVLANRRTPFDTNFWRARSANDVQLVDLGRARAGAGTFVPLLLSIAVVRALFIGITISRLLHVKERQFGSLVGEVLFPRRLVPA